LSCASSFTGICTGLHNFPRIGYLTLALLPTPAPENHQALYGLALKGKDLAAIKP